MASRVKRVESQVSLSHRLISLPLKSRVPSRVLGNLGVWRIPHSIVLFSIVVLLISSSAHAELSDAKLREKLDAKLTEARQAYTTAKDAWTALQTQPDYREFSKEKLKYIQLLLAYKSDHPELRRHYDDLVRKQQKCSETMKKLSEAAKKLDAIIRAIDEQFGSAMGDRRDLLNSVQKLDSQIRFINTRLKSLKTRKEKLELDKGQEKEITGIMMALVSNRIVQIESSLAKCSKSREKLWTTAKSWSGTTTTIDGFENSIISMEAIVNQIVGYRLDIEMWDNVITVVQKDAVIRKLRGTVAIISSGRQILLHEGDTFHGKDGQMKTGADGYAWIQIHTGASIEIGPNTSTEKTGEGLVRFIGPLPPEIWLANQSVKISGTSDIVVYSSQSGSKAKLFIPGGLEIEINGKKIETGGAEAGGVSMWLDELDIRTRLTKEEMQRLYQVIRGFKPDDTVKFLLE